MKNEGYEEIDLRRIFRLLLSKAWLIAIAMAVGATIAFCVTKFTMPLKYRSYTSLYVKNNNTVLETDSVINLNDLNASKSLVSTYIAVLRDDTVMAEIGKRLIKAYGEEKISTVFPTYEENGVKKVSVAALSSAITMAAVDETEVLKITAVTQDPKVSAGLCNIVAETAPDFLVRVIGAGSVEAIGLARINRNPISPNVPKNTLIGAMVGMLLAAAAVVVFDLFNTTVRSGDELETRCGKAVLGSIHSVTGQKDNKNKKDDQPEHFSVLDEKIPFYVVESYKAMRTNIIFSLSMAERKILAVSSPNPGDGKSTTASNAALTLAQMEHRVLLIDADMRKPVQHKIFKLKNNKGFSSLISKMDKLDDCVKKNVVKNLDVITSGPKPPNPSELLASQNTEKVLAELAEKYDYIVIDTPPVNVVSDAMGMSGYIAGMLLVVRYGVTTFEDIEDAMKKLELSKMNLLGFVLNDVAKKSSDGYSYNYKYKYYRSKYGDYSYGYGYGSSDNEDKKVGESG